MSEASMAPEFEHVPVGWSEQSFIDAGGFVAVVLNYNKKGMIANAVRSACFQDYTSFEVLVLDDASTDGSALEALEAAKACAKEGCRARIRVFLNKENRTITGQWELAVSVSKGNWFGMFCGDDVSKRDRMSRAASRIGKWPGIWGICTNINPSAHKSQSARLINSKENIVWSGRDDDFPKYPFFGCSAFWSREVFKYPLARLNLDDFYLYWCVISRRVGTDAPALVWALDLCTVDYSVGSGITTAHKVAAINTRNPIVRYWRNYEADKIHYRKTSYIWGPINDYIAQHAVSERVGKAAFGWTRLSNLRASNWLGKWRLWYFILITDRHDDYGGNRKKIVGIANEHMLLYMFGRCWYVLVFSTRRVVRFVFEKMHRQCLEEIDARTNSSGGNG